MQLNYTCFYIFYYGLVLKSTHFMLGCLLYLYIRGVNVNVLTHAINLKI